LFIIWYLLIGVFKEFIQRYSRIESIVYSVENLFLPANFIIPLNYFNPNLRSRQLLIYLLMR
jgi:hypothetical protein